MTSSLLDSGLSATVAVDTLRAVLTFVIGTAMLDSGASGDNFWSGLDTPPAAPPPPRWT